MNSFRGPLCLTRTTRHLSTVHRGVAFEERTLRLLRDHFSMSLTRVGGRGDGGIDLLGWWWLPPCTTAASATTSSKPPTVGQGLATAEGRNTNLSRRRRIRVVGQCKAEKKKMGPNYVRELEGVMYRLAAASSSLDGISFMGSEDHSDAISSSEDASSSENPGSEPQVAILVSQSPFTQATILRAQSSPIPFLLLHLPPVQLGPSPHASPASILDSSTQPEPHYPLASTTTLPLSASGTPSEPSPEATPSKGDSIATALCNKALAGTQGLLQGQMEVRWERDLTNVGVGSPGLWWNGRRLESWVPERG